jgi:hypothetical protein
MSHQHQHMQLLWRLQLRLLLLVVLCQWVPSSGSSSCKVRQQSCLSLE